MAKQTIDIGTSANKGDGDPLRTAFRKINENFTELYAANGDADGAATSVLPSGDGIYSLGSADKQWADVFIADFIYLNGTRIEVNSNGALLVGGSNPIQTQDTMGSVFGDDSTLLVDGVNNTIPSANITGTEASNWNTAYLWGDHSTAGYAPQATTYTKVEVDAAIAAVDPFSGDVTGSVFADDSTLLVDGVNGTISAANLTGALPALDGSSLTGVTASSVAFADVTATPTTLAGYGITDALTSGGDFEGNLSGSVFADDSTLLVDGVNGTVNISNQSIDALSDVNTTTYAGAPSRSMQPLIWDDIDNVWYPGNGISLTSNLTMEDNSFIMLRENAYLNFEGSITDGFDTKFLVVNPTANRTIRLPDADGTIALTNQLNGVDLGQYTGNVEGDLVGSVFADDSTLLVDGVNGKIVGEVTGTISSTNWMASSDSYLTIANGGATGPGPIQIVASANLDITSGNNNDINMSPHGSGRVKVSDGGLGIVEAANFMGHADQFMYLSSKTTGSESTHIALNSTSGVQTTMYGAVDFASGGSATFNGNAIFDTGVQEKFATLTGSTGTVTHDCDTGHVFYLTGATGDITANFTNLGLTAEYGTNLTVIINQGVTPYEVTAVQIGGVAQTINWQGGSAPTGNANGIDSFSFTILNDGGTYVVLGQMVDFT